MEEIAFEAQHYGGPYPITMLRASGPEGSWTIGPERSGSAQMKFRLAYPEGWDIMRCLEERKLIDDPHNPEYWRLAAMQSGNDIGWVITQDLAVSFINAVRRDEPGDAEALLLEAGFEFEHEIGAGNGGRSAPVRVFGKKLTKIGWVTVMVGAHDIDIDLQKPRQDFWWNIGSMHDRHEGAAFGGTAYYFVPFQNFRANIVRWMLDKAIPWIEANHKTLTAKSLRRA